MMQLWSMESLLDKTVRQQSILVDHTSFLQPSEHAPGLHFNYSPSTPDCPMMDFSEIALVALIDCYSCSCTCNLRTPFKGFVSWCSFAAASMSARLLAWIPPVDSCISELRLLWVVQDWILPSFKRRARLLMRAWWCSQKEYPSSVFCLHCQPLPSYRLHCVDPIASSRWDAGALRLLFLNLMTSWAQDSSCLGRVPPSASVSRLTENTAAAAVCPPLFLLLFLSIPHLPSSRLLRCCKNPLLPWSSRSSLSGPVSVLTKWYKKNLPLGSCTKQGECRALATWVLNLLLPSSKPGKPFSTISDTASEAVRPFLPALSNTFTRDWNKTEQSEASLSASKVE